MNEETPRERRIAAFHFIFPNLPTGRLLKTREAFIMIQGIGYNLPITVD